MYESDEPSDKPILGYPEICNAIYSVFSKSLPPLSKSTKLIPMRRLTATICLTLAVLLGSVGCRTASNYGAAAYVTYSDEEVCDRVYEKRPHYLQEAKRRGLRCLWDYGKFRYAQPEFTDVSAPFKMGKVSPTITARKSPPPPQTKTRPSTQRRSDPNKVISSSIVTGKLYPF